MRVALWIPAMAALSFAPAPPAEDRPVIALAARLVAQAALRPALVDRLVEAAREIHGPRDALSDDEAFPSTTATALSVDPYARDLLAAGLSPLGRFGTMRKCGVVVLPERDRVRRRCRLPGRGIRADAPVSRTPHTSSCRSALPDDLALAGAPSLGKPTPAAELLPAIADLLRGGTPDRA